MAELIRTLVVDDEEQIRYFLTKTLERVGYVVATASSGEEALELLRDTAFDVAIVDLNLGGRVGGLKVLEAIRWRWPSMAAVILTAHGSLESAVAAIREGVDGYLLKPAKPEEVREAVQQALERRGSLWQSVQESHIVQRGSFFVDLEQHLVTHDGKTLDLTPQEFKLLVHLMQNTPKVIAPPELVQVVRGYDSEDLFEARKIIKWYIHRLRQQVEPDPSNPQHIVNVRGVGYKFQE
jgi:DNA-binding response OmpR family regulator